MNRSRPAALAAALAQVAAARGNLVDWCDMHRQAAERRALATAPDADRAELEALVWADEEYGRALDVWGALRSAHDALAAAVEAATTHPRQDATAKPPPRSTRTRSTT